MRISALCKDCKDRKDVFWELSHQASPLAYASHIVVKIAGGSLLLLFFLTTLTYLPISFRNPAEIRDFAS